MGCGAASGLALSSKVQGCRREPISRDGWILKAEIIAVFLFAAFLTDWYNGK
jgi:hypothetical protein